MTKQKACSFSTMKHDIPEDIEQPIFENDCVKVVWDREEKRLFVRGNGWEFDVGKSSNSVVAGLGWNLSKFSEVFVLEVWLGQIVFEMEWNR